MQTPELMTILAIFAAIIGCIAVGFFARGLYDRINELAKNNLPIQNTMNIDEEKIERFLLSPPFGIRIRQMTAFAFFVGFIAGMTFAAILIYLSK